MKRFILALILVCGISNIVAGKVNNPNHPGYNVAAQITGLISACLHKNVFNFIQDSFHLSYPLHSHDRDTVYAKVKNLKKAITLLEKKCGVSVIKDRNTDAFSAPFNYNLYISTYTRSFYADIKNEPKGSKEEIERMHVCFGVVCSLLKTRIADGVFDEEETKAAEILINLLKLEIDHFKTVLSYF